ncbi:hypothetical protein GCM10007036_18190 [Alsobacter metallidurans]|uniref:Lipoprotein n=1 Tax=Alsobacter metallidurans TaxID=340221 RepID=A0A917MHU0_9HYPH|nr:hypothetical protein [Alsobacter metallidurans]GGH17034.1 hypothetical protein GCM10007036_18190 [Alsobacter metallidurans]
MRLPLFLLVTIALAGCNTAGADRTSIVSVPQDVPRKLDRYSSVNPDCTPIPGIVGRIVVPPKNGRASFRDGVDYTTFPASNVRHVCNMKRIRSLQLWYTPNPGFTGTDALVAEALYPSGSSTRRAYGISVR